MQLPKATAFLFLRDKNRLCLWGSIDKIHKQISPFLDTLSI